MSPTDNQVNDPNKGKDKDHAGPPKLSQNNADDANLADGKPKSVTPKKGDKGDKEFTLLELHYKDQLEKDEQEKEKKDTLYYHCLSSNSARQSKSTTKTYLWWTKTTSIP